MFDDLRRNLIGKVLVVLSSITLLWIVIDLARNWPKQTEFPYQKGLLIWGSLTASSSLPSFNFYLLWGIALILFLVGIIFWISANKKLVHHYWTRYLTEIFLNTITIFFSALLILAIFANNLWHLKFRLLLIGTALGLLIIAIHLKIRENSTKD